MPQITFIEPDGNPRVVDAPAGGSAMMAAVDARVRGIEATCLGDCVCATCHVYVAPEDVARLPPPSEEEQETLENVVATAGESSRLSCQIVVTAALDGLVLRIPDRQ